jgi:hypothetical protein
VDASRFDALTRSLTGTGSRRRLLGGFVAGAIGLAGWRGSDGRTCSARGTVCREHATCCSGLCGEKDRTGRRRCACPGDAVTCEGVCCPDSAQVCGYRQTPDTIGVIPGCCLPPGTELEGGCNDETKKRCCAFFFGSASQYTCDPATNRCIDPNTGV